jgi:hypothetical protein
MWYGNENKCEKQEIAMNTKRRKKMNMDKRKYPSEDNFEIKHNQTLKRREPRKTFLKEEKEVHPSICAAQ